MFVQVIRGKVKDADGVRREWDRWEKDLKPGAAGYLGSTGGITKDGQFVGVARFESADAARRNSQRPEQGEWFKAFSSHLAGDASFAESTEIDEMGPGGSNDAGFVQVMHGTADKARMRALDKVFVENMQSSRPDIIGGYTAWHEGDRFTAVNYFTSEAAAREGEKKELPGELQKAFQEFGEITKGVEFLDIPNPWLR